MKGLTVAFILIHAAPSGWTYPPACCEEGHCYVVDCSEVHEIENAWAYRDIRFHHIVVRPSPDGSCHACFNERTKAGYCLFVPERTV